MIIRRQGQSGWLVCLMALLLCVLTGMLLPAGTHASSDMEKRVLVGYYENEVFQEGAQEGAVKTGYAYEYYQKIAEYAGWQYQYVYGEFGDLYQMLLDGKIDVLAGLARRADREELVGYPEVAMGNETYNLVKHDDDDAITLDPKTLAGRKIGVLDSAMADTLTEFGKRDCSWENKGGRENAKLGDVKRFWRRRGCRTESLHEQ